MVGIIMPLWASHVSKEKWPYCPAICRPDWISTSCSACENGPLAQISEATLVGAQSKRSTAILDAEREHRAVASANISRFYPLFISCHVKKISPTVIGNLYLYSYNPALHLFGWGVLDMGRLIPQHKFHIWHSCNKMTDSNVLQYFQNRFWLGWPQWATTS